MASFRRPRGTVVRHIPDWKTGQLHGLNNVTTGGGGGTFNGFGLVNDTGQGQPIVVWHMYAFARLVAAPTTIQVGTLGFYAGAPLSLTTPGQPLDLQQPYLGGSVWGIPPASAPNTNDFMDIPSSPTGWVWPHDWPICIVRPGQSLLYYVVGPVQDVAVGWIWEIADAV
jgi:hypothetical protein